jgi:Zn-dependent M16 (insulinase) family peptidase
MNACMKVMAHMLTYDWLWNEVRVKGGAYGTGFAANMNGILESIPIVIQIR